MLKGYKHSEETKRKIVQTRRERGSYTAWNKGIPWSEEAKNKISLARKGQISSRKGVKLSEETKRKIGLKSKGRKHTEEYKKMMSDFNKNNPNSGQFKKGSIPPNKGKKLSEETKEKIRKARAKQILPLKDTKIEIKIQMFLKELGYDFFTHQYMKDIEHGYQCDILIPSLNLVIECDGDYWHKYPIGNDIDHIRTKELLEQGFKILRLWENEINQMQVEDFKERLSGICISSC